MKKVFMILGVFVVVVVITFFLFMNSLTSDVRGKWVLTSPEDGCFTAITFSDGPAKNRGISFEETTGNSKTTYIGVHEVEGKELTIHVDNFDKIESFKMIYALQDDELTLDYSWNNEAYSCTYENVD